MAHHRIIQLHLRNEGTIGRAIRVGKEQTTVVSRDSHILVTGVNDSPHQLKFVPGFMRAGIKYFIGRVRQAAGVMFQRIFGVLIVGSVGQQPAVFRVGLEQQSEQDTEGDSVGAGQIFTGLVVQPFQFFSHRYRQFGDGLHVDALPQAIPQAHRVVA